MGKAGGLERESRQSGCLPLPGLQGFDCLIPKVFSVHHLSSVKSRSSMCSLGARETLGALPASLLAAFSCSPQTQFPDMQIFVRGGNRLHGHQQAPYFPSLSCLPLPKSNGTVAALFLLHQGCWQGCSWSRYLQNLQQSQDWHPNGLCFQGCVCRCLVLVFSSVKEA